MTPRTASQRYKNVFLASLPKAEIERLGPHLSPVPLKLRQQLLNGHANQHVYFVEEGLASVVLTMQNGATIEVGVIGRDGVVGLPMLLGGSQMPGKTFIQVEGFGFRMDAQFAKEQFEQPGPLRDQLQKYLVANLLQTSQNAACNRLHTISERLARWLLTCHDRVEFDRMPLTHDFLAHMLGVPRTTVTVAAGMLHQAGLIDYSRGHVTIQNRAELENAVCECYAVVRKEFDRLGLL